MRKHKVLNLLLKIPQCTSGSLLGDVPDLLLKGALCMTSSWVPSVRAAHYLSQEMRTPSAQNSRKDLSLQIVLSADCSKYQTQNAP